MIVLDQLYMQDGRYLSKMKKMGCYSYMHRLTVKMEQAGLLKLKKKGRIKYIYLTEKGRNIAKDLWIITQVNTT